MGISCTKNVFSDHGVHHKDIPSLPPSPALQCGASATDRPFVCHCLALNRLPTPEPGRDDQRRGMILGAPLPSSKGARFRVFGSPAGCQRGNGKRHVVSAGEYSDGFYPGARVLSSAIVYQTHRNQTQFRRNRTP